jgi:hypothetical protein
VLVTRLSPAAGFFVFVAGPLWLAGGMIQAGFRGWSKAPFVNGVAIERNGAGVEVQLRPTGAGRYFDGTFLGLWLVGWAAGEAFALWLLGTGAWALLTGRPPGAGREPLEVAPALGVGAFLLGWTVLWTVGGVAALHAFCRLWWGRDRLTATGGELHVMRRSGIFVHRNRYSREALRQFYRLEPGRSLMADTADGPVELTQLGTPAQQEEIVAALTTALRLAPPETLPPRLPAEWEEMRAPEGGVLLVKRQATRRIQAHVATVVALALVAIAAALVDAATRQQGFPALAVLVTAPALGMCWVTVRLHFAREEWRVDRGRVTEQRRFLGKVRTRFAGTAVRVSETRDSDGDAWFAVDLEGPETAGRRKIMSQLRDPTEPRRIAAWLAAKAGLPLVDAIPSPVDKEVELAAAIRQLEASGRFGRWIARLLAKTQRK